MSKPLNDRLVQLYNNLDALNIEFRNRIANLDDVASFTVELVSDLVDRRHNTLKAIGKFKSEADTNFLRFVEKAMEQASSTETYKTIRRLLEIKNATTDRERLVIIDDTICVNASKEEEARALFASLRPKEETIETLDMPELKDPEALNEQVSPYESHVAFNNELKTRIEKYLRGIEGEQHKYTYKAKNGKEIAKDYVNDYDRLCDVLTFLNIKEEDVVEKVLNIAFIPRKIKDAFIEAIANTKFYHENYDSRLINADLVSDLTAYLETAPDYEEQAVREMLGLLSVQNKKLTRVWNIGYVPYKDVTKFKDLILRTSYLRDKVPMEDSNRNALNSLVEDLRNIDENTTKEEKEALMSRYNILRRGIETDKAKKDVASDGVYVPLRYIKEYERSTAKLNEIKMSKKEALALKEESLNETDLKRQALETLQANLLSQRNANTLEQSKMLELFGIPAVTGTPKSDKPIYDVEAILKAALNQSEETRADALDEALKKIIGKGGSKAELPALPTPNRALNAYPKTQEEINSYFMDVLKDNQALASEENMNRAVSQILDTLTEGRHSELDSLLTEVQTLLANSRGPVGIVKSEDSQVLVQEALPSAQITSRVKGSRKWHSFKNAKIFLKSLIAVSLVDEEEERLGTNPYVSRLIKIVDNIVDRCKMALGDEDTRNNKLNGHYYTVNIQDVDATGLPDALNHPELYLDDYDAVLIQGIMKGEALINEANKRLRELVTYINEGTKKRFGFEYKRIEQLEQEIEMNNLDIKHEKENHMPDSETIIARNEDAIDIANREIKEIKVYITEHSQELFISEYAKINVLNGSINDLREKQALAQIKLFERAKERQDIAKAQEYRDSFMKLTSLDLNKYKDLNIAREDVGNLMSLEPEELVQQMNYVIKNLNKFLADTRQAPEIKRAMSDIETLVDSASIISDSTVRLFK
ncbi:MAG: hypothetical protein NC483_03525 [Ruminococcus sp.]|nr:hypothetical protein [Ruminococcus sp.]